MLIKQETLLGRGTQAESSKVREPKRTALHGACSLRFYGNEVSFGQSSCLPGSEFMFGVRQGPSMYANASLSQERF